MSQQMNKGNESQSEILTQLKIANRLTVMELRNKDVKQSEIIKVLATSGASSKEIAEVLDTTTNTVSVALSQLKKAVAKKDATPKE